MAFSPSEVQGPNMTSMLSKISGFRGMSLKVKLKG